MCGINGIIYKKNKPEIFEVHKMNQAIKHRGPDDEGIYKHQNMILGHVRLSIIDISKKGKQPMTNDGRFWISYNGEIYNFKEIKKELIDLGHKFFSETDTEVILCSYKEWGVNCFAKFNGMWSFVILDIEQNHIIISRDRYGVKPCYYYNDNEKFILSSEIKGVLASNSKIELDKNKLLLSSKDLEKSFTTIYKNLNIVPPGCIFKVNLNNFKINISRWWKGLENLPEININKNVLREKLKNLLIDATQKRLISDVKIATSLSGGLDSSIIFSILNKLKKNNDNLSLNPFIVNHNNIKTIENALNLSKILNKTPIIIDYNEDSFMDFSKKLSAIEIPDPYFSQLEIYKAQNKNGYKISIDGHGADECLGGYEKDIENFSMFFQNSLLDIYRTISNLKGPDHLKKTIERLNLIPNLHGFNLDIKQYVKNKINDNEYVESEDIDIVHPFLIEDLEELINYSFPFQVLYLNSSFGHMQWLLNKWDKASMANSVEIRSPFLDWRFFQYALALPPEYKIKNGTNKSILRDAFSDILPKEIINDNLKQGLPIVNFRKKNISNHLINETINQVDFKTSDKWDSKKIIADYNDNDLRPKKINKILHIIRIYLMNKGFNDRKENLNNLKKTNKENFNRLN
tara:strand:+ start:816 stop:2708 length:1893 start_codon:yes stop_codon:yes gene_type:complete